MVHRRTSSSRFGQEALLVPLLMASLLVSAVARADTGQTLQQASSLVAWLGPLGINPMLGLGAMGVTAWFGLSDLPSNLAFLSGPIWWSVFFALGLLIQFGKSFKVTKPVAEFIGTGETILALAVFAGSLAFPLTKSTPPLPTQEAAVLGTALFFAGLALATLSTIIIVRMALDILIWISPVPFIDLIFEVTKMALTAILVALAIFFPSAATAINVMLAVVALLLLRWALRIVRFGVSTAWWASLGRGQRPDQLPESGRLHGYALRFPGRAFLQRVHLQVEDRGIAVAGSGSREALGEGTPLSWFSTPVGTLVQADGRSVLVSAQYGLVVQEAAARTGAELRSVGGTLKALWSKPSPIEPPRALQNP